MLGILKVIINIIEIKRMVELNRIPYFGSYESRITETCDPETWGT